MRIASDTAKHVAARGARRLHLSRFDRDDLQQDILLALVQRATGYDPGRGAWSTFAALIARHVVADWAQASRETCEPEFVPLDVDDFACGCSATQRDRTDQALSLDLARVATELPAAPQSLLRQIGIVGDVADAQRASSQPCAPFYRGLGDLRFWLRVTGMRPPHGVPRRRAAGEA